MQRAEEYVASGGGGQALEHAGGSSATEGAIGAAAGAAGGSVVGRPGTGAAVGGLAVPYLLRLMSRDPRVAAGPIALAFADVVTLLAYFNLARLLV